LRGSDKKEGEGVIEDGGGPVVVTWHGAGSMEPGTRAPRQPFGDQCIVYFSNFPVSALFLVQRMKRLLQRTCFVLIRFGKPCLPSGTTKSMIFLRSREIKRRYNPSALISREFSDFDRALTIRVVSQSESRK